MSEELIREARAAITAAEEKVSDMCSGSRRWVMSIPARPGYDHDLTIGAGLAAGKRLADALEAAEAVVPAPQTLRNTECEQHGITAEVWEQLETALDAYEAVRR